MRVVVTGGAGFIGSHAVDALVARGDDVHVLDNLATGLRERVHPSATLNEGDIREDVRAVFDDVRPELCLHLAAQADVATSVERPDYDADVNIVGTVRVLEAARAHGTHVVFTSTGGAIYGECDGPATEDAPRRPISPYGIAKLSGEEYLAGWNRLHGTHHVAVRLANVYGPRQAASLEGGVVAIFLDRLAGGEQSTIFGDGEQTRDFIFVLEVVRALLLAADHQDGVFNVGTGVGTSINSLYDACVRVSGAEVSALHAPARAGDVLHSVVDPGRAAGELGWRNEVALEAGLARTWAAVKE